VQEGEYGYNYKICLSGILGGYLVDNNLLSSNRLLGLKNLHISCIFELTHTPLV